jgi:hypothetical protein
MTISFRARLATDHQRTTYGLYDASVVVKTMTPVPYIIPSYVGAKAGVFGDAPLCRRHEVSTPAKICVQTGARGR